MQYTKQHHHCLPKLFVFFKSILANPFFTQGLYASLLSKKCLLNSSTLLAPTFPLPKSKFLSPCHPQHFLTSALPIPLCLHKSPVAGSKANSDMFPWKNWLQHCLRWYKSHGRTKPARGCPVLSNSW